MQDFDFLCHHGDWNWHKMQITRLTIVYLGADLRKHQSSASLAFVCGEFTDDLWIPRTKGQ